jgi:glycosyltransferase involved in cell wall biosynthesis
LVKQNKRLLGVRISAITITYNEEANIEECLRGVSWADEIIVVDAMSTDATCDIAARFTPKVFRKPWQGYAEARRHAIGQARSEWILSLDADERVTPELRDEIQAVLEQPESDGYLIPRKAYFLGRWIKHCGWYPGYVLRLFKRSEVRVTEKMVHEGLRVNGRVGTLDNHLLHYTYPSVESYFGRFERYTALAAQELDATGRKARISDIILRPPFQFAKMYIAKLGFLDGMEGFILCVFSSLYVFVKYVKLWEIQHQKGAQSHESKRGDVR